MNFAVAASPFVDRCLDMAQSAALPKATDASIAVVGLGQTGLALASAFANSGTVYGYDRDPQRLEDSARFLEDRKQEAPKLRFGADPECLVEADVIFVCVPVQFRHDHKADEAGLLAATRTVAENMKRGGVVVFEGTFAPGTTEDRCIPQLEKFSGMRLYGDFHVGYSPEWAGFAQPARRSDDARKIVAGSSPAAADFLARLYARIVGESVFQATSIRAAEAARVLETVQRDVNIALINEMMQLFDALDIRVSEVVAAAGAKWNFQAYFPGLVGGRSLTGDPFHLLNAGRAHGLAMDIVAAARSVNERTANFVADKLHAMLAPQARDLCGFRVLVLGRSFKDNCPDTRDSKSFAVMDSLWARGADVYSYDPVASAGEYEGGRGAVVLDRAEDFAPYDAVVVAAAHDAFREEFDVFRLAALAPRRAPVVDLRKLFDPELARRHFSYWTV